MKRGRKTERGLLGWAGSDVWQCEKGCTSEIVSLQRDVSAAASLDEEVRGRQLDGAHLRERESRGSQQMSQSSHTKFVLTTAVHCERDPLLCAKSGRRAIEAGCTSWRAARAMARCRRVYWTAEAYRNSFRGRSSSLARRARVVEGKPGFRRERAAPSWQRRRA